MKFTIQILNSLECLNFCKLFENLIVKECIITDTCMHIYYTEWQNVYVISDLKFLTVKN